MVENSSCLGKLIGLFLGSFIAFVLGFRQAQLETIRSQLEHPDEYICGLGAFANVGVGMFYAIPGGLAGAIIFSWLGRRVTTNKDEFEVDVTDEH